MMLQCYHCSHTWECTITREDIIAGRVSKIECPKCHTIERVSILPGGDLGNIRITDMADRAEDGNQFYEENEEDEKE